MTDLEHVAKRLFWWQSPSDALSDPIRFLAQVMTYGTVEDVLTVRQHFSESFFREVLVNPPAGVFDPRSWNYWHIAFGIKPVPPLPKRQIPDT